MIRTFFFESQAANHQINKRTKDFFVAIPMRKHIEQFILPKSVFANLLTGKLWV